MSENARPGTPDGNQELNPNRAYGEESIPQTVGVQGQHSGSNFASGSSMNPGQQTSGNAFGGTAQTPTQETTNPTTGGTSVNNPHMSNPVTPPTSGQLGGSTFGNANTSGNAGNWDGTTTTNPTNPTDTGTTGSTSSTSWSGTGTGSTADSTTSYSTSGLGNTQTPTGVKLGKGLDVGTANLVSAVQNEQGGITIKMERNAFIDIEADVYSKRMLTKLQVPYVVHNDKMVVLGDSAFELSNIFSRETRRPMKDGLISPSEVDALGIIRLIIEKILGQPAGEGEKCYFSVPAPSIDAANNVIYHQGLFEGLLRKMGYTPSPMNEAHAVVFSELAEQNFTGIGISCGGGMFNVCVAYKTIPALAFSICRGGDWIDQNVANVLGIPSSKATAIKEKGVDLMNPKNREEEAVVIYYRNLINYTLLNIKNKFEVAQDMPEFPEPIDIVFSGGTSMIGGFAELCDEELKKIKFPIPVNRIRRAKDPLSSVARGCLIAAAIGE